MEVEFSLSHSRIYFRFIEALLNEQSGVEDWLFTLEVAVHCKLALDLLEVLSMLTVDLLDLCRHVLGPNNQSSCIKLCKSFGEDFVVALA